MKIAWLSLALALAAGAPQTRAHSWYPHDCCSDRDCWPMGVDADAREPDPAIVPGGYRLRDGSFIAERDTRPSKDGVPDATVISTSKGICLFVPQPTF